MKKLLIVLICSLLAGSLVLISCAPAEFLQGTGGEEGGDEEGGKPSPTQSFQDEAPIPSTANFLSPTLVIIISDDGTNYTTEISSPPMGTADYEITAPKLARIGVEYSIKLVMVPESLNINKDQEPDGFDGNITQVFQGKTNYYYKMSAEIISGTSISINSNPIIEQVINEKKSTTWLWYITPLQVGKHKLAVNISTPVQVGNTQSLFELEHVEFEVSVFSTPLTSTPSTSASTVTPEPALLSSNKTLPGSANETATIKEFFGLITAIVTFFITLLTFQYQRKKTKISAQKKNEEKRRQEQTEKEKRIKENFLRPKKK